MVENLANQSSSDHCDETKCFVLCFRTADLYKESKCQSTMARWKQTLSVADQNIACLTAIPT